MTQPIQESLPEPLTEPRFEGFTVQLSPGSDPEVAVKRARTALEASLGRSAERWRIEAVHPSEPGLFDLFPPREGELGVSEAWDVAYALVEQPSVTDAEPSFEIVLDAGDVQESTSEEDGTRPDGRFAADLQQARSRMVPQADRRSAGMGRCSPSGR